jgi:hypothetical protein
MICAQTLCVCRVENRYTLFRIMLYFGAIRAQFPWRRKRTPLAAPNFSSTTFSGIAWRSLHCSIP